MRRHARLRGSIRTEAAVEAAGLEPLAEGWTTHSETYDDVGTIACRIQDLHPVWETASRRPVVTFADKDIALDMSIDIAAPREVVWDRLADPFYRNIMFQSERQEVEAPVDGRTDATSAFLCYHGGMLGKSGPAHHVIVEWRPFDRVVFKESLPMPGAPVHELQAFEFSDIPTGTRLRRLCGNMTGPTYKRALSRVVLRALRSQMRDGMDHFRQAVEESLGAPAAI